MSTGLTWQIISPDSESTRRLGELLGNNLSGGEVIELVADLGGGKTTFTQGLAHGLGSKDNVASPTFTLNKIYKGKAAEIHHYDFYRLSEPGILRDQLAESLNDKNVVTVVEWSDIVKDVLPLNRISIKFEPTTDDPNERQITITYPQDYTGIIKKAETAWPDVRP